MFARKGWNGTRVGDIAREAGVAYGLVYHYFANKDEILDALLEESWVLLERVIGEVAASSAPLSEKLRNVVGFVLEGWVLDPDRVAVVLVEGLRGPRFHAPGQLQAFTRILDALTRLLGAHEAELRPGALPGLEALFLLGGLEVLLSALQAGLVPCDSAALAAHREGLISTFLHGILPPGA